MLKLAETLQNHFEDPYHRGTCEGATHAAMMECDETGCQLEFELLLFADGGVSQAWFDGQGCETCEALASLLASRSEGQAAAALRSLDLAAWCRELGWPVEQLLELAGCVALPLQTLQAALTAPLFATEDDIADGTGFGGPSLREEC